MAQQIPELESLLNTDFEVPYGEVQQVSPLVRRVTANNPSKFTFRGTGTYIVGQGKVAIIDPGPDDAAHVEALLQAVRGEEVTHILITHTHIDHSPATKAVKEATGATVYAFAPHPAEPDSAEVEGEDPVAPTPASLNPVTPTSPANDSAATSAVSSQAVASQNGKTKDDAQQKSQPAQASEDNSEKSGDLDFMPDETVRHGDVISLSDYATSGSASSSSGVRQPASSPARGSAANWTIECLHTPGHISNHICFALREEEALFTGDHIMGWSSTVIPPPHGNLADYLSSLELLLPRTDKTYYPTHGPPITLNPIPYPSPQPPSTLSLPAISPQDFAAALLRHRQNRTNQILAELAEGPKTLEQLVATLYADKPKDLHKPAAQSVKAHLIHLTQTNQIHPHQPSQNTPTTYSLTSPK